MAKKASTTDFVSVSKKGAPILVIHRKSTGKDYEFVSLDDVLTYDDAAIMDDADAVSKRALELFDKTLPKELEKELKAAPQPFKESLGVRVAYGLHFSGYLEVLAGDLTPGE